MELSELLLADNFYATIDSPKKLQGFCDELYRTYAKKLGTPALGKRVLTSAGIGDRTLAKVANKTKLTDYFLGQPITINQALLDMFDGMKKTRNSAFPYQIFEGMLHEVKHLSQNKTAKAVAHNSGDFNDKDTVVTLSRVVDNLDKYKHPVVRFMESANRRMSYENHLWEIDAREFAHLELFELFKQNGDDAILPFLNSYVKDETRARKRNLNLYLRLYEIPEKLEEFFAEQQSNPVRKVLGKITTKFDEVTIGAIEKANSIMERMFGKDFQKYRELVAKEHELSDEYFEAKLDAEECETYKTSGEYEQIKNAYDEANNSRSDFAYSVLQEQESQIIENMFPGYKTIQSGLQERELPEDSVALKDFNAMLASFITHTQSKNKDADVKGN